MDQKAKENAYKRRELEGQVDLIEANFRKEKGQMMEEINILS